MGCLLDLQYEMFEIPDVSAALFLGADIELVALMLVISIYPRISSASLDFLLVPAVCQW